MQTLENIYTFRTRNFTVTVEAMEEPYPDFSFDDTGETQEMIERGDWLSIPHFAPLARKRESSGSFKDQTPRKALSVYIASRADTRKARAEGSGILWWRGLSVNKHLATIISDLLRFQIKQAERHGLDSISITVPRAKQIARELRDSIKEQVKPVSRLDRIFSSVEKAKFAEY